MVAIFTGIGAGLTRSSASTLGSMGLLGSAVPGRGGENVSVNAANGNLLVSRRDEFLTGRGLDIAVDRTYNSLAQTGDRDNDDKWQMGLVRRVLGLTGLLNIAGSTVKRLGGDGALVTYTYQNRNGENAYWTTDGDGAHEKLVRNGNSWTWTDGGSQVTESYEASATVLGEWRITSQTDIGGQSLNFGYVGDTDLVQYVVTASGESIQFAWSNDTIPQIMTATVNGTVAKTQYAYDGNGRLKTVGTDFTPGDFDTSDGNVYNTEYTYGANGLLSRITQADGSRLDISYDGSGRVTLLSQTVSASPLGNVTRDTMLTYASGYTTVQGPDGQVTRLDYDSAGQLTKITAPPAYSGAAAQVIEFDYDADGNLDSVTGADGKVTSYAYDALGNQTLATDPNSNTVKRWYDAGNRVTAERTYGANGVPQYTRYAYDGAGQLRYVVDPDGRVTESRYDAYGLLARQVEYPGSSYPDAYVEGTALGVAAMDNWRDGLSDRRSVQNRTFTYDFRGNATAVTDWREATATGEPVTAGSFVRTHYTHDEVGRLIARHNEGELAETFVYDGLNRLVSSVDLNGGTTSIVFNDAALQTVITTAGGYTTTQTYNKAGDLVSATGSGAFDPNGTVTYKHDKLGRVRVATDALGQSRYFVYDRAGRMVGEVTTDGRLTEYRYDAANRVIAETRYLLGLGDAGLAYPAALMAQLADPDNTLEIAALRPTSHDWDLWSWKVYDDAGRVIQAIDGDGGVVAYSYDPSDRLIKTTSYATKIAVAPLIASPPTTPVAVTTANADTVSRVFYDKSGNLIGTLDGEGYLIEHVYDQAGQKVEEVAYTTRTAASNWDSGTFAQLRGSAGTAARRTHYVYQGGLLRYQVDALGHATRYDYNAAGKLTGTRAYALPITTPSYDFDTIAMAAEVASGPNDRTTDTVYDSAGRVAISYDAKGVATTYSYDVSGNVVKVAVAVDSDANGTLDTTVRVTRNWYTASNHLRFSVDPEGFVRGYEYDAEGNTTRVVTWDAPISVTDTTAIAQVNSLASGSYSDQRYLYGQDRRLYWSYDGENVATIYLYARDGQVAQMYEAWQTPDMRASAFHYDRAGRKVFEARQWGTAEEAGTSYAYDGLGNRTAVVDARGNASYYTYDEVGRVASVTDAGGGVTSYVYNAFGEVVQVTDPRGAVTTTTYDDMGRMATVTDALGYVTTYTYTAFGEVATVTRAGAMTAFAYDKLGRVVQSTDAMGYAEVYTYDAVGNRLTSTNKLGGTTTYGYDRRGLMVSETLPIASMTASGATVAASVTNTFAYDARGNRTAMIEAAGLTEQRTTQYIYDKNDRLIEQVDPAFLGITPHTAMTYDARGNMTSRTDPAGARTIWFYDDADRVAVEVSAVGTYTAYSYDQNGNVTATRIYATAVTVPTDGGAKDEAPAAPTGDYRETTFVYDALDRLVSSMTRPVLLGFYGYYESDPPAYVIDDSAGIPSFYTYDENGNVTSFYDERGHGEIFYDLLGRKTHQLDAANYLTQWTYDADGNVLTETRYGALFAFQFDGSTPVGTPSGDDRVTAFTYDLVGNRLTEARANVLTHDGNGAHVGATATISYLYNGLGQVVRKTEATGDQTNYTYDVDGRLLIEARAAFVDDSGVAVTPTVDYYYDGVGNLVRTRARGSATAVERITTYSYSGAKLAAMNDAEVQDSDVTNGKATYYAYDAAGRLTRTSYQRYDSTGTVIGVYEAASSAYDAAGRTILSWIERWDGSSWTDQAPRTAMTYNAFGEMATMSVGGVLQQQNLYDVVGRLVATTAGDGVWKLYAYDWKNNRTGEIASAGTDLSGMTFADAFALVGSDGINGTWTEYDGRKMAILVVEEGRYLSTTDAAQTLTTARAYNAFGEVASETNAAGATIDYAYNTMGRLIRTESPAVSITLEDGTQTSVRPTEHMYYDAGGRLVASRDANGNLTRMTLLAGTGYGDNRALVTGTFFADGGLKGTNYDIHGDARELIDEHGYRTLQTFDKLGRMVTRQELRDPGTTADDYTDTYVWDGLGQQLKHGASWALDYETTDYDALGRVIASVAFGGDATTVGYVWDAAMVTTGVGTFGGWVQTTTMANGRAAVAKSDLFERVTGKTDLGGNVTAYAYDVAGRLAGSMMSGFTTTNLWLNSGRIGALSLRTERSDNPTDNWTQDDANYAYDLAGNRILERLDRTISGDAGAPEAPPSNPGNGGGGGGGGGYGGGGWGDPRPQEQIQVYGDPGLPSNVTVVTKSIKNQSATYDALGRLKTWAEAGTDYAPAASASYEYDAAGNIRRTNSSFAALDDSSNQTATTRDYWFRFDSMNRVVVDQGELVGGTIVAGTSGREIAYDLAGRRVSVVSGGVQELYGYDEANRLIASYQRAAGSTDPGVLRSTYGYDAAGRQIAQTDYDATGTTAVYSRTATYNTKGQLASDLTATLKADNKTYTSSTTYYYSEGTANYALGAVTSQVTTSSVSGTSGVTTATTTNRYAWFDGAVQAQITYADGTNGPWNTYLYYDGAARLRLAEIRDGKARYVDYVTDELGQVVHKRQLGIVSGQTGGPHEVSYRFGGRQLGVTGNDGSQDMAMAASIADRQQVTPANQGTFRNKQVTGAGHADFAQSYDPFNSYGQGSPGTASAGGYTVQAGDTLQGIAYQVWGDGALWYKIAEANGLTAGAMLIAGQQLVLPTGVVRTAHNAATMRPYDPADAIGNLVPDTSPAPTQAARKKSNKCGVFGAILLAVVAVAVAVASAGTLTPVGGAILGSVVSQGVGLATGIQEKFSFKGVAIAALSAGVATGVGQVVGQGAVAGSQFLGDVARGALGSAITQGVGVATGLQDKFSWAGVAAAGIGAGVGGAAMRELGSRTGAFKDGAWTRAPSFGIEAAGGAAALIANAATRSAIEGSSFGDNILAALPDTLGNLLGGRIGRALQGSGRAKPPVADDRAKSQARNGNPGPVVQDPTAQASADPKATVTVTEGEGWAEVVVNLARERGGRSDVDYSFSSTRARALNDNPDLPGFETRDGGPALNMQDWQQRYDVYRTRRDADTRMLDPYNDALTEAAFKIDYDRLVAEEAARASSTSSYSLADYGNSNFSWLTGMTVVERYGWNNGSQIATTRPRTSQSSRKGQIGQITATLAGKQVEAFAKAAIETGASPKDVKYIRGLGKALPLIGSAITFKDLRQTGFSVQAALAGTAANEVTGDRIIWGGAAIGTAIEPGLGTLIVGGGAWAADQFFGWSDSAGVKAAQEYELRINGKKVRP